MLDRGADICVKQDVNTESALHAVCKMRDVPIELLELLLDRGLDPNVKYKLYHDSSRLYTPLDLICEESKPKINIVQLLLAKGSGFDLAVLRTKRSFPTMRSTLERWQTCMAIIVLQELAIYYQMDASSFIDLWLYLHG